MRIAILTWGFPPAHIGGTEIATQSLARHLAARGHEVTVITPGGPGVPCRETVEGVEIRRTCHRLPRSLRYLWFSMSAIVLVGRYRPDVVHAQSLWVGTPALVCRLLYSIPYVVWGRGSDVYYPELCGGPLGRTLARMAIRHADAVLALTPHMRHAMQELGALSVEVIPNAVDLDAYEGLSGMRCRQSLGIASTARVVVCVARLVPIKGVKFLIQAMTEVRRSAANVLLLIAGDGADRGVLERTASGLGLDDCVRFLGLVSNRDVPLVMGTGNVFVLPSLSEGFGLVLIEAMAAGLPVVASDVRGVSEVVDPERNAIMVQPRDSHGIAVAVARILCDADLHSEMSRESLRRARQFQWNTIVTRLEDVYRLVLVCRARPKPEAYAP